MSRNRTTGADLRKPLGKHGEVIARDGKLRRHHWAWRGRPNSYAVGLCAGESPSDLGIGNQRRSSEALHENSADGCSKYTGVPYRLCAVKDLRVLRNQLGSAAHAMVPTNPDGCVRWRRAITKESSILLPIGARSAARVCRVHRQARLPHPRRQERLVCRAHLDPLTKRQGAQDRLNRLLEVGHPAFVARVLTERANRQAEAALCRPLPGGGVHHARDRKRCDVQVFGQPEGQHVLLAHPPYSVTKQTTPLPLHARRLPLDTRTTLGDMTHLQGPCLCAPYAGERGRRISLPITMGHRVSNSSAAQVERSAGGRYLRMGPPALLSTGLW